MKVEFRTNMRRKNRDQFSGTIHEEKRRVRKDLKSGLSATGVRIEPGTFKI